MYIALPNKRVTIDCHEYDWLVCMGRKQRCVDTLYILQSGRLPYVGDIPWPCVFWWVSLG